MKSGAAREILLSTYRNGITVNFIKCTTEAEKNSRTIGYSFLITICRHHFLWRHEYLSPTIDCHITDHLSIAFNNIDCKFDTDYFCGRSSSKYRRFGIDFFPFIAV